VVNNASFAAGTSPLAPGTIVAIFGSNLDDGSKNPFSAFGANGELLTTLGGASVTFNGISAPLFSAFPGQLNVQIPLELANANSATVVVTMGGQSSAPQQVSLSSLSPGIFTTAQTGSGQGVIQIANTTTFAAPAGSIPGSAARAVKAGEFITIYCTGLGPVNNPPGTGKAASGDPLSTTTTTPTVTIGGVAATVSFSGLAPGFVGLYQVDVEIPQGVPGGSTQPLVLSIGGVKSNTVTIAIAGLAASKISAGREHTCVVNNGGGVLCWGHNEFGQLGNGTTTDSSTPVPVKGLSSGVVSIASSGHGANCALTKAGSVWCWGTGEVGQLGNGARNDSNVPVQVVGPAGNAALTGVVQISAGQDHMCALTSTGAALCWGDNSFGDLGDPQLNNHFSATPLQVSGLSSGVASISPSASYSCAVTTAGGALCWGTNGPLGANGATSPTPIAVLNTAGSAPLSGVAALATGYDHACALTTEGTELCWGGNGAGQIGNGTEGNSFNLPTQVLNSNASAPLSGVAQITAGEEDSCVVTSSGGMLCWGYNAEGEIGENTRDHYDSPVPVTGLASGVIQIASGYRHNCAITSTGGVMCWGFNEYGQLGDGTTRVSAVPMAVVGAGGIGLLNLF
jgi:uncharacterized protein (TIGR03437 family)